MKISVLTILILTLMAGLAMVQMDANTENHIQVLSETEMLTTQGLGACEIVVGPNKDPVGDCADKACYTVKSVFGIAYTLAKHVADPYEKCKGFDPNHDCFELIVKDKDGNKLLQVCAYKHVYRFACHGLLRVKTLALPRPFVDDRPGCIDVGPMASNTSS